MEKKINKDALFQVVLEKKSKKWQMNLRYTVSTEQLPELIAYLERFKGKFLPTNNKT